MSDTPDKNLKIGIEFPVNPAGATQAKSVIEDLKLSTKEASKEGIKGAEDLEKATEKATLKQGEMKKLVNELARDFPGLGLAARAAMNPVVFILSTLLLLFAKAKEALRAWNAELDAAGAAASRVGWDLREAFAELERSRLISGRIQQSGLKELIEQQEQFTTATNNSVAALNRQTNAMVAIRDSKLAIELARIDAAVAGGRMTDLEALEAKENARLKAQHEKRITSAQQTVAEADIKSREGGELYSQIYELNQMLAPLKAGEKNRQALLSDQGIPAEIADATAKLEAQQKALPDIDKLRTEQEYQANFLRNMGAPVETQPGWSAYGRATSALNKALEQKADADRQAAYVKLLKDRQARLTGDQNLQEQIESEIQKRREQARGVGADVANLRATAADQYQLDATLTGNEQERVAIEQLTDALRQKQKILDSIAQASHALNAADQFTLRQLDEINRRIASLESRTLNQK